MDGQMDLRGEGKVTFSARAFPALLPAFSSTISLPPQFFFFFEEGGFAEPEQAKWTFFLHLILH